MGINPDNKNLKVIVMIWKKVTKRTRIPRVSNPI